ncbi:MAG: hypothetical protein QOK40_1958 [Miltoncostaeaceae bacterium]|jgi:hypothetical protein|nr:hypothetical protein [Miltoncostaeaceae bacterium]
MAATAAPEGWGPLIDALTPHVSPEWTRQAREHGHQGWVRLVALVDAHYQLSIPMVTEKIAQAMAELAIDREAERTGWQQVMERARADRHALQARVVDAAPTLLPDTLMAYFERSVEPVSRV